ncbi:hypothetical protein ACLOJK_021461 [Asimina triloba]
MDAASILGGDQTLRILFMKLMQVEVAVEMMNPVNGVQRKLLCIAYGQFQDLFLLPKLKYCLSTAPAELPILRSIVETLTRGMGASEDSAATAALAFRDVCDACRKKLCGSLDGLFHIYHQGVSVESGAYQLTPEDSLYLVEALSLVITELPQEHAKKALEMLCLPIVNPLQEIINRGPEVLQQVFARQFTVHIDRLATIFRHVNHPEVVAGAIQSLWPILKTIFDLRAWDMRTMESLCRACKYAIFGSDPACSVYLGSLLEALFNHTAHLLTTPLTWTSMFPWSCREACISILTFLSDVLDLANSSVGERYRSIIDGVFLPRGASLTRILIASLAGGLPSSRLEEVTYAQLALARTYGVKVVEWARFSVSLIPSTAVTEAERSNFLNALMKAASGAGVASLSGPVRELSEVCRRNRSVHEIVQGALRPLELNFTAASS